jgi:hypothetical protein
VITDLTARDARLTAYVRPDDIPIPQSDPRYHQGTGRENRVEGPLAEVDGTFHIEVYHYPTLLGDVFDRQRCINLFNQPLIEQQVDIHELMNMYDYPCTCTLSLFP